MIDDPAKPTESSPVAAEPSVPPDPPAPPLAAAPPPPPVPPAPPRYEPPRYEPAPERRGNGAAYLPLLACAVVLVGAGYLYWQSQSADAQIAARLDGLEQRLQTVEQRPVPAPPNLAPLEQRLTTLEQTPPPVAHLDQGGRDELAALAGRVDQITARENQLGVQQQNDAAKLASQLAAQDSRLAATTATTGAAAGQLEALAARQARTARLQEAATALAAGRPLGTIPDAPPALAQFATKAPPTEAALRLSFDAAAAAAYKAGQPIPDNAPFLQRVLARLQESVTVRQGSQVLLGDPITGILARARQQLDAGDVAGSVKTLDSLVGPALAAVAPWRQQAQSLVDARAALLAMAQG
ncbi:MAG: hypothetical protein WDN49_12840 [Acetobacteraceae bacterium]